jgi:hypothetical protein
MNLDSTKYRLYSLSGTDWIGIDALEAPSLIDLSVEQTRLSVIKSVIADDYPTEPLGTRRSMQGNDGTQWPKEGNLLMSDEVDSLPLSFLNSWSLLVEISQYHPKDLVMENRFDVSNQHDGFPKFLESTSIMNSSAFIWLSSDTRELVIVFLSTRSVWNCAGIEMVEFRNRIHPFEMKGGVSRDVLELLKEIDSYIRPVIDINIPRFDKIVCLGNGVGAGIATLAAPYYSELYLNKHVICCTFGSPRVGDEMFVRWFNARVLTSYRLANEDDIVPSIPFWAPYVHVHDAICLRHDGYARKGFEESAFERPLIYPFEEFVNMIRHCQEHSPREYHKRLELLSNIAKKKGATIPSRMSGA